MSCDGHAISFMSFDSHMIKKCQHLADAIIDLGAQCLSGRVLDSRLRAAGSSLTGVTALWSLSKTHLS